MPRYLVIGGFFGRHRGVAVPVMIEAGEEIEYDGPPGAGLVPLDQEAVAKFASVPRGQNFDRDRARNMRGLTSTMRRRVAEAGEATGMNLAPRPKERRPMARYRLTAPAYLAANGHPVPQYFRAGAIVDFDGPRSTSMVLVD